MKKVSTILFCVIIILGVGNRAVRLWNLHEEQVQRREETKQAVKHIQELDLGLDSRFYYGSIDESEQEAYQTILDGVRQHKETITVEIPDAEQVNEIYQCVLMDFPEYFWCSGSAKTTSYTGAAEYSEIEPEYSYSKEESKVREKEIQKAASKIIKKMDDNDSDYQKVKFIYEYIIDSTDYDLNSEDNQNIYSVLVGKNSVCAGYSKTMQYLLNRIGIFCTYVVGTVDSGDSHAWNIVKCDGEYYNVDATWGDPVFAHQMDEVKDNHIVYDYLCCSDKELYTTHHADSKFQYPECTSEDLNYYRLNKMYYKKYDKNEAYDVMKTSINQKAEETVFKYADESVYEEAEKSLIEHELIAEGARYLCQRYSLRQVNYYYQKDDKMHKITVFWEYGE